MSTHPETLEKVDPFSRPFIESMARGEVLLQRCQRCSKYQYYARPLCVHCGAPDPEWIPASGAGTIYSIVRSHVQAVADLAPPYFVGMIELAEGPRIIATVYGDEPVIGDPVRLGWRERADELLPRVPVFELASDASG